jgi:hypothetical protein
VNKSDKLSADSVGVLKTWLREAYALVFGGPQVADDSIIFVAGDGETPCLYQLYEDLISAASAEDLHPSAGNDIFNTVFFKFPFIFTSI